MKNKKLIGFFLLIAAVGVLAVFNRGNTDSPADIVFYTSDDNVQIVASENGDGYAGFVGWDENEDYTKRTIKLIDKTGTQVKELELPRKKRDEYNGFFIGEKYVVAYTNRLFGVDRSGRLFNLDIYSYDGRLIQTDNFICLARDEYIDDVFLRRANMQYHFEWADSETLLMYGPLAIYSINILDGNVNKIVEIGQLASDWDCEKYIQISDGRVPGKDSFLYGIIPFKDGHSDENGIVFRLYDKMELNNLSYRVVQWKDGQITLLTDYMTQSGIYYDSVTGIITDIPPSDTQSDGITLCPGYKVVLQQENGKYIVKITPEN